MLGIAESSGQSHVSTPSIQFGSVGRANHVPMHGQKAIWKPKSYGTVSGDKATKDEKVTVDNMAVEKLGNGALTASAEKRSAVLSNLFKGNLLENFNVDNSTCSLAQIRATFYPKFENEKSDQEVNFPSVLLLFFLLMWFK